MKEYPAVHYFAKHSYQPTLIIGNGPSANEVKDHIEQIQNKFVTIGMNRSWKLIDTRYHVIMFHIDHLEELVKYKYPHKGTTLWTYKDYSEMWVREVEKGDVVFVPSVAEPQNPMHKYNIAGMISTDLSDCSYADMTGMYALEVALWMRCNPIYLIGFDLYGGHFCDKEKPEDDWRDVQVELFDMCAEQVTNEMHWVSVYNCNPKSRISGFEKVEFERVLNG